MDPVGYDKLAKFLSAHPEFQHFRRFSTLNIKVLLYLQAELAHAEEDLKDIIEDDKELAKKEAKKRGYPFSFLDLKASAKDPTLDAYQWKKIKEIRELLYRYNEALLQQAQMLEFHPPPRTEVAGLRDWLHHPRGGGFIFETLTESDVWSEKHEDDMIAIYRQQDQVDSFTKWVCTHFLSWFHDVWGHRGKERYDEEMGAITYDFPTIRSYTYVASVLISGLLPASAIIVLYALKTTSAKLIVVLVYNLVFSWVFGFLVKARRAEIFAAATAFAAVQVALVANSGECVSGCQG